MNLEELSMQLENAVESLYIMWLTHEEGRVGHVVMSNALKANYDHLYNISKAITGIVENCAADVITKCEVDA